MIYVLLILTILVWLRLVWLLCVVVNDRFKK